MKTRKARFFLGLSVLAFVAAGVAGGLAFFYYEQARMGSPVQRAAAVERESVSVFFPDERGRLERKVIDVQRRLPERAKADVLFRGNLRE